MLVASTSYNDYDNEIIIIIMLIMLVIDVLVCPGDLISAL